MYADNELIFRGGEEDAMDRDLLDHLIHYAFSAPNSSGEKSPDDAAEFLTQEDRAALDSLGSADQFISRLLSQPVGVGEGALANGETRLASSPLTITTHAGEGMDSTLYPDLVESYNSSLQVERVEWLCQYLKRAEIGGGAQGKVYLIECQDNFSGYRALKLYSPLPYRNRQTYHAEMIRMVKVAALVHRNRHDNLIEVERFDQWHDGIYAMVMHLIDGFDLHHLLQRRVVDLLPQSLGSKAWTELNKVVFTKHGVERVGLTPGIAVNVIAKCLRALSLLHGLGILHCDIKPSNIMVDCWGSIRLIDIGSAFHVSARPEQHAWTPRYAPPEVLEGGEWTFQSDLASLGYVLVEWLSGRPEVLTESRDGPLNLKNLPEGSTSIASLDVDIGHALADVKRDLPSRLKELIPEDAQRCASLMDLIRKLIHPNPLDRFSDANEAIVGAHQFQRDLSRGDMAMYWVGVMANWVNSVKSAPSATSAS